MRTGTKRWLAILLAVFCFVVLSVVIAQRETPSETVRIGFAGPSLIETNALLFTITNQNGFPVRFEVSVQSASVFRMRHGVTKTGDVYRSNTFTFYVPAPAMNRWRVSGKYWNSPAPKLSPIRSKVVGTLLKMKLSRFSAWVARPPARGH